jgi:hypothetical protein
VAELSGLMNLVGLPNTSLQALAAQLGQQAAAGQEQAGQEHEGGSKAGEGSGAQPPAGGAA